MSGMGAGSQGGAPRWGCTEGVQAADFTENHCESDIPFHASADNSSFVFTAKLFKKFYNLIKNELLIFQKGISFCKFSKCKKTYTQSSV